MTIDLGIKFSSDFNLPENPKSNTSAKWNSSFQGHHLIPTFVANKFDFLKVLAQIDADPDNPGASLYKHNNFDANGMWLPSNEIDSLASGLAMHQGGHTAQYNSLVKDLLEDVQAKHNLGGIDANTDFSDPALKSRLEAAAKELDAVSKYLRNGLMADRIPGVDGSDPDRMAPKFMINSSDPHAASVGGFESGYPNDVVSDYRDFLSLHFTNGDPVNGTAKGSYWGLSTASDPNLSKRRLRPTCFQLDGFKFHGRSSSIRLFGWPPALASRVDLR